MTPNDLAVPASGVRGWGNDSWLAGPNFDLLAAALLLTATFTHIVGNMLLLDAGVLRTSTQVLAVCLGVLLIFVSLARQLSNPLWALILTYGLLWLLAKIPVALAQVLFLVVAGIAAVNVARTLRIERCHWPALVLMALAATVTVLGVHRAYTSFDMLSRMHAGFIHQDTLHHASIAAMVKHYGVVSTGLHGLVATPYHAFSHHLVAAISLLSGVGVVEVYGVAPWVLFAPVLIFAVCVASFSMSGAAPFRAAAVWGIAVLILALTPRLLQPWGVYDTYFNSESYLVAVGLLCLALPLLLKRDLALIDLLLATLVAAMLAQSKATVALIYAGLWLTRFIFLSRGQRRINFVGFLLVGLAVAASVVGPAQANSGYGNLRAFDFIANYTWLGHHVREASELWAAGTGMSPAIGLMAASAIFSFLFLHFLPSWIVIVQVARRKGSRGVFEDPIAVYSLAAAGVGVLVAATLRMPGGAAYFVTHVAFMVSLPAVIALLTCVVEKRDPGARRLLVAGVLLILLANVQALHRVSAWGRPYATEHNALVDQLIEMRSGAPADHVYVATDAMLDANPIEHCAAKPFFFPAVSERSWVGVIRANAADCRFGFYGYASYGVTADHPAVLIAPRLLPGMVIVDANPQSEAR